MLLSPPRDRSTGRPATPAAAKVTAGQRERLGGPGVTCCGGALSPDPSEPRPSVLLLLLLRTNKYQYECKYIEVLLKKNNIALQIRNQK
ncbi:hypothetical protein PBY51_016416 [Eleginops maclovinus]|uniref:Uncharacterized protein n=1 Tax=Eleginops maclovinus TaxID=56733 RepID=A0AAN8ASA2_ELEMC|nr:hypothetical protein PBY51_016416 [Eleginops maclovinus]